MDVEQIREVMLFRRLLPLNSILALLLDQAAVIGPLNPFRRVNSVADLAGEDAPGLDPLFETGDVDKADGAAAFARRADLFSVNHDRELFEADPAGHLARRLALRLVWIKALHTVLTTHRLIALAQ